MDDSHADTAGLDGSNQEKRLIVVLNAPAVYRRNDIKSLILSRSSSVNDESMMNSSAKEVKLYGDLGLLSSPPLVSGSSFHARRWLYKRMAMNPFQTSQWRTSSLGRLAGVVLLMLGFSVVLLRFRISAQSPGSVGFTPNVVFRFCYLVGCFLWCLFGLTVWATRKENEHVRAIAGVNEARLHPAGTAFSSVAVLAALVTVGVGWNAFIFHLHLQSRNTEFLAISNRSEALLFLIVAITAGLVEEYIFRGYLQWQFTTLTHNVWIGTLLQLAFFTMAHLYQGWSGMVSVFLLGAVLTGAAFWRRTLIPGMIAHALGDALGPLIFLTHHFRHGR